MTERPLLPAVIAGLAIAVLAFVGNLLHTALAIVAQGLALLPR